MQKSKYLIYAGGGMVLVGFLLFAGGLLAVGESSSTPASIFALICMVIMFIGAATIFVGATYSNELKLSCEEKNKKAIVDLQLNIANRFQNAFDKINDGREWQSIQKFSVDNVPHHPDADRSVSVKYAGSPKKLVEVVLKGQTGIVKLDGVQQGTFHLKTSDVAIQLAIDACLRHLSYK